MKKLLIGIAVIIVAPTTAAIVVTGALALQEAYFKNQADRKNN